MEPRHIELPVESVTVLEDRALVTRSASIALDAGSHPLVVVGVSPTTPGLPLGTDA